MPAKEIKAGLRRRVRDLARSQEWAEDRSARSLGVQENFLAAFPPEAGRRVALYRAIRGEVGTDRIRERYLAAGAFLFYPRVAGEGDLVFLPHAEGGGWKAGRFGIPEPDVPPGTEEVRAGFDLVLVPGLAFDVGGRRLGRGHGYYDRFLSGLRPGTVTVGLAYARQVVPEVPVDPWDVPVDVVVTEEGVLRARRGGGGS